MKSTSVVVLFFFPFLMGAACDQYTPMPTNDKQHASIENLNAMNDTLLLKIGDKEFTATLLHNPTTAAFKALLPLTVNMVELNRNEKYFRLSRSLPTNESTPGTINTGDLMLYGSNTFVLFYEGFSTSYRYTKLGRINESTGLAAAVGKGNVTVTISVK
ncbi:cyclophilin-like fold protein [Chryseolinea sp. H1M3-3]|uniref:cyclophilin-like fold protein n=1 Tax=Chryseolinea sp. H1M3-3 TaxID=3034144 RepID=UPI0023ED695C|nr:cyclophilin-like fold protein [Chryseolinea sp. H1M3-3]